MKSIRKGLSVLLVAALLLALAVPAFAVQTSGVDVPNVYLRGQGWPPILNEAGEDVYTKAFPEEGLGGMVKQCMPSFIRALTTDTKEAWDAYRDELRSVVMPCFGPFFLDKNGENSDGTHVDWDWEHGNLPDLKSANGYGMLTYKFFNDWRLDPFVNARLLNDYIQDVKKATGSDKINLIARCEATNIVLAYFTEFGYDDVNCAEMYVSSVKGSDFVSAFFSGKITVNGDAVVRFKNQQLSIEDELTNELVDALIEFTGDTLLLDVAAFGVELLGIKLYDEVLAPLIRETYGTLPGIWSLVDEEDYKAARKGIYGGVEEEYAGMLEKLDHYDAAVRQRVDEILLDAVASGVKVAVFAKYGAYQVQPIGKHSSDIGDGSVALEDASFGATVAKYGRTLSESYLQKAEKNGTAKYIAPDHMVDASTCLLPDHTWFIYNSEHRDFSDYIHDYMYRFLAADGNMTVFDDPAMPQFAIANGDTQTMTPMTQDNAPVIDAPSRSIREVNFKDVVLRLVKALWNFLLNLLKKKGA